ncbi:MAG: 23S rRNA (guanosine(2251)-2'-O)-methyltransferase RlmB [Mycoplasma sp.]
MAKNFLFGKNAILDALKNNIKIGTVYAMNNELKKIDQSIEIEIVTKNFFQKFQNVNHQFVAAEIKQEISYLNIDILIERMQKKEKGTILILDEIEDGGNFGAIIRSATAFGVDAIIYKNTHQVQINDYVIKTSLGGVYQIDFVKVANLTNTIERLKKANWWVYATALDDKSVDINKVEFDNKAVLIIGNEQKGISKIVLSNADFLVKIPMTNKMQSLNASVATGIILSKNFQKLN